MQLSDLEHADNNKDLSGISDDGDPVLLIEHHRPHHCLFSTILNHPILFEISINADILYSN